MNSWVDINICSSIIIIYKVFIAKQPPVKQKNTINVVQKEQQNMKYEDYKHGEVLLKEHNSW